jgi:hypothetical protein
MSTPLRQVFHVSRLAPGIGDREVRQILAISRRNNRMLDLTGVPACTGQHFAQVLEGREDALASLLPRIVADRRHVDFRQVFDRPLATREYPLWSLAYLSERAISEELESLLVDDLPPLGVTLDAIRRLQPDTVLGAL